MGGKRKIMIIAGEASGDMHGAWLVRAMRTFNPELEFFGIGGNALRRAGVLIRVDNSKMSVVGISEAILKLKILLNALKIAKEDLKRRRPDLLIIIDFPDFNLRVATMAKKLGVSVMYYISPQIWAWRTGRIKKIKEVVDHMIVIFPFEVAFYEKRHIPVTFVGHPLLDNMTSGMSEKGEDIGGDSMLIGLLPGSRNEEVIRLLPTMVQVADILSEKIPSIRFTIPVASSVDSALVESITKSITNKEAGRFLIVQDRVREVLNKATLLITASGTVTLEAAIAGTPMIIVYKVSGLSYWLGKCLIRVKHIGLVNLVAGRRIVPELIQHEASAEKIARLALQMLKDESTLAEIRIQLHHVARRLGSPGASKRAARVALEMLSRNSNLSEKGIGLKGD